MLDKHTASSLFSNVEVDIPIYSYTRINTQTPILKKTEEDV